MLDVIINFMTGFVHVVGLMIEYIGVLFVIFYVALALVRLPMKKYNTEYVRHHMAKRIIFALEFIIAADILLVTSTTDLAEIYRLGGIVVIRILLGYTLKQEADDN